MVELDDEDYFVQSHCICIRFTLDEDSSRILENRLIEFKNVRKEKHPKRVKLDEGESAIHFSYNTAYNAFKNNHYKLTAGMTPFGKKKFTAKAAEDRIRTISNFFDLLNGLKFDNLEGTSCTTFLFSTDKYSIVGGMNIPINIELSPDITKKIGIVQIGGFKLHFKDSMIGVDEVDIELLNDNLALTTTVDYKVSTVDSLPEKSVRMSKVLANLLVKTKQ